MCNCSLIVPHAPLEGSLIQRTVEENKSMSSIWLHLSSIIVLVFVQLESFFIEWTTYHSWIINNHKPISFSIWNDPIYFVLLFRLDRSFLVANAQSDTYHIIFCSDGFCKMTGFTRAEVMQRSSTTEFLHGPMTSLQAVNLIKEALSNGFEKHFEILYYRKNGKYDSTHIRTIFVFPANKC